MAHSYTPIATEEPYYQSGLSAVDLAKMTSRRGNLGRNAEISEGIENLIKCNNRLDRHKAKIGTTVDDSSFRDSVDAERQKGLKLVREINAALTANKGGDRMTLKKFADQFAEAAKAYESVCQQIEKRLNKSVEANDKKKNKSRTRSDSDHDPNDLEAALGSDSSSNDPQQRLLQQQEEDVQFMEYNVDELDKRKTAIHQIERDVTEVAEMMKDLHLLVDQQGEQIDAIENNIIVTTQKVTEGHGELVQADKYQASSRKKQCCILFILLGIAGVIVLGVMVFKKS